MLRHAAVCAAAATIVAGAGSAAPAERPVPFRGAGVSFTHPSAWKARLAGYLDIYLRRYLIVALSTEHLHRPVPECVQEGNTTRCGPDGPILDTLPAGGVYITWWEDGSGIHPDRKLTGVPGSITRLAGRLTKIDIDPTGVAPWALGICPKGTTGSVALVVARMQLPGRGTRFMAACANTTDFPGFFRQLLPMLRSTSVRD